MLHAATKLVRASTATQTLSQRATSCSSRSSRSCSGGPGAHRHRERSSVTAARYTTGSSTGTTAKQLLSAPHTHSRAHQHQQLLQVRRKRRMGTSMGTSMAATASDTTLGSFEASDIDGKLVKLSKYLGKVVLVVNVASK